jgi:hypothetical protein
MGAALAIGRSEQFCNSGDYLCEECDPGSVSGEYSSKNPPLEEVALNGAP